jgi:hypothetical protein
VDEEGNVTVFEIGDKVKNVAGLRGTIEQCHGNGTYTVRYNDGRADLKLPARHITALPAGMSLFILIRHNNMCVYKYLLCILLKLRLVPPRNDLNGSGMLLL